VALAALLGAVTAFLAYQIWLASPGCPGLDNGGYCLPTDIWGTLAHQIGRFNLAQYGLVVLPALAGAFVGAPLIAREIENGTHHLAWTQGVSRLRWVIVKLVLVILPLLVLATAVGILEIVFLNVQGAQVNRWDVFDQQAPIVPAATLFAMALGVAFGALIGRSVQAMAVTLVTFVVVRVGIAELIRPYHYMAPLELKTTNLAALGSQTNPTAWWLDSSPNFYDASGHLLGSTPSAGQQAVTAIQYFQPGDRFWAFQTIESAILCGLALLVLGFAVYWVTRRVT
jgi:ABC-type transport system involved in multi-copper enzyme maturation permease subunit